MAVKLLCLSEDVPVRSCYVFTSDRRCGFPAKMEAGDKVELAFSRTTFYLRPKSTETWMPLEKLVNHRHLTPDSRSWPSRPTELALAVCRGVPVTEEGP